MSLTLEVECVGLSQVSRGIEMLSVERGGMIYSLQFFLYLASVRSSLQASDTALLLSVDDL